MPGAHNDQEAILPLGNPVGVSAIVHVCQWVKAHRSFIQDTSLLEVRLGVGDGASSHVNPSSDLDGLLVPHRLELFVQDQTLSLLPLDQIEGDDVVLV